MRIAIGSDHGGFSLKQALAGYLKQKNHCIIDVGCFSKDSCDYPEYSYSAAKLVQTKKADRAIVICKSGIGNSIVANKLSGVRAALCYNVKAARLSRMHNDSNVLVLGSIFVKSDLAKKIIRVWLNTEFEGGRHKKRLAQIKDIERKVRCYKK